jgi:hypothetical protein
MRYHELGNKIYFSMDEKDVNFTKKLYSNKTIL